MQSVPIQSLPSKPSALRKKLEDEGDLLVTMRGRPFAIILNLSGDENVGEVLLMVSRLRAQMAIHSIREQAHKNNLDKMTGKDINSLIKKTRAKQKQQRLMQ